MIVIRDSSFAGFSHVFLSTLAIYIIRNGLVELDLIELNIRLLKNITIGCH